MCTFADAWSAHACSKEDLDLSPERWELPIHMLDAVFAVSHGEDPACQGDAARAIIDRLRSTIDRGCAKGGGMP